MTTTWTLHGHGRLPWAEIRPLLEGCTCVWADLDGFHLGPAPELPPLATHLWGWDDNRYIRLRLDEHVAYAAVLHPQADLPAPPPATTEPVTVTIRHNVPLRTRDDPQPGPLPHEAHTLTYDLLELPGPHPTTFLRGQRR